MTIAERNEMLHDFDQYVRVRAEDVRDNLYESGEKKLYIAFGRMAEALERRERFCQGGYELKVW